MSKMKKIHQIIKDFSYQAINHNLANFASSTAFFMFVSMVPIIMIICCIMPFTPVTEPMLIEAVADFAPETVMHLVSSLIQSVYASTAGILSFSIVAAIWASGRAMLSLMQGFNAVCDAEETRGYFLLRAIACLYTVIMIVGIMFLLIVEVFGRNLLHFIYRIVPAIKPFIGILLQGRHVISFVFLTCLITIIYNAMPRRKSHFKSQLPGAIFASVLWNAFSWLFSLYVRFADFSIYGSLAIIVIFLLWLYFNMYILMLGIYINTYLKPFRKGFRMARQRRQEEASEENEEDSSSSDT